MQIELRFWAAGRIFSRVWLNIKYLRVHKRMIPARTQENDSGGQAPPSQPPGRPEAGPNSEPKMNEMLVKPMENENSGPFLIPPGQGCQYYIITKSYTKELNPKIW